TARAFAELLGDQESVSLLEQTLKEEKETDEKLTDLAETINSEAAGSESAGSIGADRTTIKHKAKSAGR
ncbi:MAG: DUF892 family protein, partial [Candidatus Acidiferrales bacterium]